MVYDRRMTTDTSGAHGADEPQEGTMARTATTQSNDRRPVYGPPEPSWRSLCDFVLYGDWCDHCRQGRELDVDDV